MKYVIHSCNKRLWYANEYLIPSMINQGIDKQDIILLNDDNNIGNMASWLKSCDYIINNLDIEDGCWHLQDDVIIARDFKNLSRNICNNFDIACGFVTPAFNKNNKNKTGKVDIYEMWMSFPCIYIPNKYLKEFLFWYNTSVINDKIYEKERLTGQMDDFFFTRFIRTMHHNISSYNFKPNLVDHIDYLLGGSTLGRKKTHRALYFEDKDLVDELENKLKGRR